MAIVGGSQLQKVCQWIQILVKSKRLSHLSNIYRWTMADMDMTLLPMKCPPHPGIEPGTTGLWSQHANHYTMGAIYITICFNIFYNKWNTSMLWLICQTTDQVARRASVDLWLPHQPFMAVNWLTHQPTDPPPGERWLDKLMWWWEG